MQGRLTAVCLILSITAVVLTVAAQVKRDAFLFPGALELARQTDVGLWKKARKEVWSMRYTEETKESTLATTSTFNSIFNVKG